MGSNFLGEVNGYSHRASPILSAAELLARTGVNLQRGMNYRESGGLLSVFLVLEHDGVYTDEWDEDSETYTFQGHDSTLRQAQGELPKGKQVDQLAMYSDGRVTDNGKFYKAAQAFAEGVRREPLQIEVYEKLDPGVWFDKGIFNLVDAKQVTAGAKGAERKVFKFYLNPAGNRAGSAESEADYHERMLSATEKVAIWSEAQGRCAVCSTQSALHFAKSNGNNFALLCETHASRPSRGLLG
jgi:hypothetical protein